MFRAGLKLLRASTNWDKQLYAALETSTMTLHQLEKKLFPIFFSCNENFELLDECNIPLCIVIDHFHSLNNSTSIYKVSFEISCFLISSRIYKTSQESSELNVILFRGRGSFPVSSPRYFPFSSPQMKTHYLQNLF